MNEQQALREARKRWGKNAHIRAYADGSRAVGYTVMDLMFAVQGQGKTWAAAFFNVDEKKNQEHLKFEAHGQPCPRCSLPMRDPLITHNIEPDERATVEHVICRSCWINERLPPKAHRWNLERREALRTATWGLHYILMDLGQGKVARLRTRLSEIERPLSIALGQKLLARRPSWSGKRRRRS